MLRPTVRCMQTEKFIGTIHWPVWQQWLVIEPIIGPQNVDNVQHNGMWTGVLSSNIMTTWIDQSPADSSRKVPELHRYDVSLSLVWTGCWTVISPVVSDLRPRDDLVMLLYHNELALYQHKNVCFRGTFLWKISCPRVFLFLFFVSYQIIIGDDTHVYALVSIFFSKRRIYVFMVHAV